MKDIRTLTSLRFFAAAAVVYYHSSQHFSCLGSRTEANAICFSHVVSFFFVLSGFILSLKYSDMAGQWKLFWLKRWSRIWPAHVGSLALLVVLLPDLFGITRHNAFAAGLNCLMLQSWVPVPSYYFSFNSASWSNSTECFFYLLFPLLIYGHKRSPRWTAATVLVLTILVLVIASTINLARFQLNGPCYHGLLYVFPPIRLIDFYCGICLSSYFRRRSSWWSASEATILECSAIVAAIALSLLAAEIKGPLILGEPFLFWLTNNLLGLPSACFLVFVFAAQAGAVSQILKQQALVYLGEISFTIYMLHCVLLAHHNIFLSQRNTPLDALCFFLLLILLAAMSSRYLEKPIREFMLSRAGGNSSVCAQSRSPAVNYFALAGHIGALVLLLHFYLPSTVIHHEPLTQHQFSSTLILRDMSVLRRPDGFRVTLCWQANSSTTLDFLEVVSTANEDRTDVVRAMHQMDMRRTLVQAGDVWEERYDIVASQAKTLSLSLYRCGASDALPFIVQARQQVVTEVDCIPSN